MAFDYDLFRSDWEVDGETIAEHTSSPPLDWSKIRNIALHYPADPSIPETPNLTNFADHLRASQRYYINDPRRGYSYGYNAVVWNGMTAEVRGDGYRCAANGSRTLNEDSFAIQVRVEGQSPNSAGVDTSTPANPLEVDAVRRLIGWEQEQAGRTLTVMPHRDLNPTRCCGDAMVAQIRDDVFDVPYPPPEVPVPANKIRLFKFDEDRPELFASGDGVTAVWLDGPQWNRLVSLGVANPDDIELLDDAEAIRYTLVGSDAPIGYDGIWANSRRI